MKMAMKKTTLVLMLLFAISLGFAQYQDVFDYVPKTDGYLSVNDGFSVQIFGKGTGYNVYNNLRGRVDIIAWKADKEYVTMIARLRGWNTDEEAFYYSIKVDGRQSKAKAEATLLFTLPDLSGYRLNLARTNDAAINLRSESSVKGKKVGQYQTNNIVTFTGKLQNKCEIDNATDYWYSIDYSGSPAWIYGKYISFPSGISITLESLGVKPAAEQSGLSNGNGVTAKNSAGTAEPASYKINVVFDKREPVFNVYKNGDILIKNEFHSFSAQRDITIKNKDKTIADIRSAMYSVYSPKLNKIFYLTYLFGDSCFAYSIDCATGEGAQLMNYHGYELVPNYSKLCMNKDGTKLFVADTTYRWEDIAILELLEIDAATNKITKRYISDFPPWRFTDFGKLNDEIFYFIEFDPTVISFFKLQDDKLKEIDNVALSDYDFEVGYQDDISPRYMQNSDYAVMNFDNWNESKTLVFGYENGKIVDCSSKIKGDAFATFFWNDNWYLLTLEEKETGIFRLYDANLNELSSVENKKVLESGQYCVNAGFDGNGNVTVNYEWSK